MMGCATLHPSYACYLTSAWHDLRQIHDYIARDNPAAARRVITSIRQEAQTLTEHPPPEKVRHPPKLGWWQPKEIRFG
ncbi:MAG: type II toxin-antitoxin system RelE/ParE family toxin [Nitrosomonadales bacterium]|nr:type II toxin-antitoxin system RelE/ParE family toxin [Nitrosomonadales bacterium]